MKHFFIQLIGKEVVLVHLERQGRGNPCVYVKPYAEAFKTKEIAESKFNDLVAKIEGDFNILHITGARCGDNIKAYDVEDAVLEEILKEIA